MAHLLFAPGKPWKRKSAAYQRQHDRLRAEVETAPKPRKSVKQNRKFAKSELFRLYAEESV